MKTENRKFLEEGINRFEEACDTIIAFQQEMKKLLEEVTSNRRKWKPLKAVNVDRASDGISIQYGYWIATEITGKSFLGENVILDCGLWWKWRQVDGPFIYASYYHKPKRIANFSWKEKNSDIRSFSSWGRTFLYLPLRTPEEINRSLNRLLDALLKQLK